MGSEWPCCFSTFGRLKRWNNEIFEGRRVGWECMDRFNGESGAGSSGTSDGRTRRV